MSDGEIKYVLMFGVPPVSAWAFYYFMHLYYRNTDKSYAYEVESTVEVSNVDGSDQFIEERKYVGESEIPGENGGDPRTRVQASGWFEKQQE